MNVTSRRLGRRLTVRFRSIGEKESHLGYTTNVSATGMFVATIRPLAPGTEVDVELKGKKSPLRLDAVVVHARKVPATWQRIHPSGMGVRFLEPTESAEGLKQLIGSASSVW